MSDSGGMDRWQWLVVGAAAVGMVYVNADRSVETRRPRYDTLAECQRDWNDPRDCENTPGGAASSGGSTGGGTGGGRSWYGPDIDKDGKVYHADGRVTSGHDVRTLSSTSFRGSHVTRSGFGGGFSRGG